MDHIRKYYNLSSSKPPGWKDRPVVQNLTEKTSGVVFTTRQKKLYLKMTPTGYDIKETIVGGGKKQINKVLVV